MSSIIKIVKQSIPDFIALSGLGSTGYGIWLFDHRVSLIVMGVVAIAIAIALRNTN